MRFEMGDMRLEIGDMRLEMGDMREVRYNSRTNPA